MKTSCCCGATKDKPCACMKKNIMKCSTKEPKCPCYKAKDLKKSLSPPVADSNNKIPNGCEQCAIGGSRSKCKKCNNALKSNDRAFSAGWSVVKSGMNPRLPKEGSTEGVLSSSGRPDLIPINNAGMPRGSDLERLKRMHAAKEAKEAKGE